MNILQRHINIVTITTSSILFMAVICIFLPVTANALGLKVTPLKYEEQLELGSSKSGFVDVANPNDVAVTVTTSVRGFRQVDLDGNLGFYQDEQLNQGIRFNIDKFDLEPREAARVAFQIDSNNLPEGGVYGVLFFEATTKKPSAVSTSIEVSPRVGTLLILENGDKGEKSGSVESLNVGFWQFGDDIAGTVTYHNTESELAVGYNPELSSKILWSDYENIETGLVLPGVARNFDFAHRGHYLGLLPVSVSDATTGGDVTAWVFAVTGIWRIILPFTLIALLATFGLYRYFSKRQ